MSPELLDPESFGLKKLRPTKGSDCYALGMVVYEVLSGQTPFAPFGPVFVIRKVLNGERPERPQGKEGRLFTETIWGVLEYCWKPWPHERIGAEAILLGLEGNPLALEPPSNLEGDEIDSDDWSDTTASDSGMFSPVYPLYNFTYPCTMIGFPGNSKEGGTSDRGARGIVKKVNLAVRGLRESWRTR